MNSWGNLDKEIDFSSAEKAIVERYEVKMKKLTYKGYRVGDIPIIWCGGNYSIYFKSHRESKYIKKNTGFEPEEMNKKFFDLCTDMGLDKEGNIIPAGETIQCDDFS